MVRNIILLIGPVELTLIFVPILLAVLALVGRWIYLDAKAQGSEWAWQWAFGIPVLFILGIVPGLLAIIAYLIVRENPSSSKKSISSDYD